MSQVGLHKGIGYESPLMDDHVVEAVLSVAYIDRDSPIEWKPLMKAAMRGILPDEYLLRTTKVGGIATGRSWIRTELLDSEESAGRVQPHGSRDY